MDQMGKAFSKYNCLDLVQRRLLGECTLQELIDARANYSKEPCRRCPLNTYDNSDYS